MANKIVLSIDDLKELTTNPIDGHKWDITVTHSTSTHIRIDVIKTIRECFGCNREFDKKDLFVRQDARVTTLYIKKEFCKECVKSIDFIIENYKPQTPPHHLKQLNRKV